MFRFDLSWNEASIRPRQDIMFRQFTAVVFLLVMALLIILKHPVLGYCLCLDAYFTGDCVCQVEQAAPAAASENLAPRCPDCCAQACTDDEQEAPSPKDPVPCDDCTKHLNVDVGEFVWHGSDKVPTDHGPWAPLPALLAPDVTRFADVWPDIPTSIRSGPPPGMIGHDPPLYLRLSVLRL